jgi:hypothetical protein
MAIVKVMCRVCGDETIFTDGTPDNQHITKTASTPDKYLCQSCGNYTDCGEQSPFEIQ